jgi:hypothetical protein
LWYALSATARLVPAFRRHAKSRRAKMQIVIATGLVCLLYLAFGLALVGVLKLIGVPWLPNWLQTPADPSARIVWGLSATSLAALAYAKVRPGLIRAGILIRSVMRYLGKDEQQRAVTAVVDEAIDAALDDPNCGDVHVLGYSFGAVVAMDALIPPTDGILRRPLSRVKSVSTLGYPADFIRLLYPDHFTG